MKTNFVEETRKLAKEFSDTSDEQAILLYLADQCVGEKNALPLSQLAFMFATSEHWIQRNVIAPSRASSAFLATSRKGVFVIESEADAQRMCDFYRQRIAAETANMNKLLSLV